MESPSDSDKTYNNFSLRVDALLMSLLNKQYPWWHGMTPEMIADMDEDESKAYFKMPLTPSFSYFGIRFSLNKVSMFSVVCPEISQVDIL